MKQLLILSFLYIPNYSLGQNTDSLKENRVVVFKDYRLDILGQKEAELNTALLKQQARSAQGYRLMVLNTSDKNYAFKVRAELLQKFPEQKLYMWFTNPYIRIKVGNFATKDEAESYQKQISKMLNGATIYLIPETIEVDPGKDFDPDNMK
ncbi:MAG TPA: SPOR domain-containing protein [Hanamia sp.]